MIFNMVGGGGGSGATLVVSSPANVSVTVSKDDKSYTKNSGSLGSATFKGLATGTWTVTISGNGQTATKTIEITADYAITIAFFSATINITYPANSTCVVTNSGGQTVASDTNTGSSTKTWTATVGATGTYTVTATATDGSGKSKSQSVSITADGQSKSVALSYELILFDNGTYAAETGGWGFSGSAGGGSINSNNLYVYGQSGNDYSDGIGYVYTRSKIDLTNFNTLNFIVSSCSDTSGGRAFGVGSSQSGDKTFTASANISTGTKSVDISSLKGSYYIKGYQVGWTSLGYFNISKVWLT